MVPNLGDASPWGDLGGLKLVIFWVLLYQWGDAVGLRGDAETKRLTMNKSESIQILSYVFANPYLVQKICFVDSFRPTVF